MSGTPTNFPYFGMPFVDMATGHVTPPWTRFLIDLWTRTGGAPGPGNTNLVQLEALLQDVDSLPVPEAVNAQLQMFADGEFLRGSTPLEVLFEDWPRRQQGPDLGLLADLQDRAPNNTLGIVPSYFYPLWDGEIGVGVALGAADRIYLYPFYVPENTRILSLAVRTAVGGAGSSAKAGIWVNAGGRPVGEPIVVDNTGAATTGVGIVTFTITDTDVRRGWYWFGLKSTGTSPTYVHIAPTASRMSSIAGAVSATLALPGGASTQMTGCYFDDAYANSMPDLTGATLVDATGGTHGIPVGVVQLS